MEIWLDSDGSEEQILKGSDGSPLGYAECEGLEYHGDYLEAAECMGLRWGGRW